jgi:hypothetical protein
VENLFFPFGKNGQTTPKKVAVGDGRHDSWAKFRLKLGAWMFSGLSRRSEA